MEDRISVVQTVTLHEVLLKSLGEVSQFHDGLGSLGVARTVLEHGELLRGFFSNDQSLKPPLTAGT